MARNGGETVRPEEFRGEEDRTYKMVGHTPHSPKGMAWLTYCRGCGLVYLKNDISRFCIKNGCLAHLLPAHDRLLYGGKR